MASFSGTLDDDPPLRNRSAVANAQRGYERYLGSFAGERWHALQLLGSLPQRPLWASMGTQGSEASDVLYVERLIAPSVVNTMPQETLEAFADHGDVTGVIDASFDDADRVLRDAAAGIDLPAVTRGLERDGVRRFCDSYAELLACITTKLAAVVPDLDTAEPSA